MAAKNFVSNGQLKRVGGHTKKVDLISFLLSSANPISRPT